VGFVARRGWVPAGILLLAGSAAFGAELRTTLPAVASFHGVPPTFFHSDVWVFNGSAQHTAEITATYRCAQASCGNAVQTFTLPPRQSRSFSDIVGTFFGAPETFGAVEFESQDLIVVSSRLYTPDRSEPTVGMFVPGMLPGDARSRSVLTSLSHDDFFRTNVGVYNPNDVTVPVLFESYTSTGVVLGQFFSNVPAHRSFQLNDPELVASLEVADNLSDFYCIVVAGAPVFSYASVIDRRSQDPIFVPGADASGLLVAKTTLPAVAHVAGFGNTLFTSDVRIWNVSTDRAAVVTARFACLEGNCGERSFTISARHMDVWNDVVSSLFHSSSAGGAMEFVSETPIVVTSRLYTPVGVQPIFPTIGMFVPGLPPEASSPTVVLNGLSHASDFSTGSRVNVGVFNQADVAQVVTYRLFDGNGNPLGQTERFFAPREFFQLNDVFAALNVSQPVESAYCLIEGSELLPLFTYAAIIDNRSQDPIFVLGEDDPEHPPITALGRPK
jgi:hypothetical protein